MSDATSSRRVRVGGGREAYPQSFHAINWLPAGAAASWAAAAAGEAAAGEAAAGTGAGGEGLRDKCAAALLVPPLVLIGIGVSLAASAAAMAIMLVVRGSDAGGQAGAPSATRFP